MSVSSFPPVVSGECIVLILGSMPGRLSLERQQYYAHPRNAFWRIMDQICGAGLQLSYEQRIARLQEAGIALWDVLRHCAREGSLDSHIDPDSEVANDFDAFLKAHQSIRRVFFNGRKAEATFRKRVWSSLPVTLQNRLLMAALPSTSPANAQLKVSEKIIRWRSEIVPCLKAE